MSQKFVTICTAPDVTNAYVLKGRLEASGIECFIDEGAARNNPILTVAVGWIKVNVPEDRVEEARKILEI